MHRLIGAHSALHTLDRAVSAVELLAVDGLVSADLDIIGLAFFKIGHGLGQRFGAADRHALDILAELFVGRADDLIAGDRLLSCRSFSSHNRY